MISLTYGTKKKV